MKRNADLNIGGIIFHFEEESCRILKDFLQSLEYNIPSSEDGAEIISDIETHIAELLLQKLEVGRQLIGKEDLEFLINDNHGHLSPHFQNYISFDCIA